MTVIVNGVEQHDLYPIYDPVGLLDGGIPSTFYSVTPSIDAENSSGFPLNGGTPTVTDSTGV